MTDVTASVDLGVETMDDEHRLQVALIGELAAAIREGRDHTATREILARLQAYTEAHFLAEQLMMRLQGYPLYGAHVQEHDRLLAELGRIGEAIGGAGDALPLAEHLQGWLTRHIMGMDRTYAEYTAQPGVSPAPHAS